VAVALGLVLLLAGCGKAGKIYGSVDHDGIWQDGYIGGFPSNGYFGTYYEVPAGTYDLYWRLYDGSSTYYPDSVSYWHSTYTVEADGGKLFFANGDDRYFDLYLGYTAIYKGGSVKSAAQTWTQDGLRITVGAASRVPASELAGKARSYFRAR